MLAAAGAVKGTKAGCTRGVAALAAQNNYKSAIRHYRLALDAKPAYPVALNNLAYALEKQLKLEEARETYERVIGIDASNKTARKRLKLLARKAGLDPAI